MSSTHDTESKNSSQSVAKSKAVALDFKRRQLVFDSFVKLRNLRQYKRKRGWSIIVDNVAINIIISLSYYMSVAAVSFKGPSGTLVYTWGAGFYGQLGRVGRGTDRCAKVATIVEIDVPVVQVACGGFHTAILTGMYLHLHLHLHPLLRFSIVQMRVRCMHGVMADQDNWVVLTNNTTCNLCPSLLTD